MMRRRQPGSAQAGSQRRSLNFWCPAALRDESGSQLIEMAIGLSIFLFVVFGFINF